MQENESIAGGTTERDEDSSRTVTEESSNVHEEHGPPTVDEKDELPCVLYSIRIFGAVEAV